MKNYSFKNVNVVWGVIEVTGFAKGDDIVVVSFDEEQFQKYVGADGKVTRFQTADESGTIAVKLSQTSITNKEFNVAHLIDRETGKGLFPMSITDRESNLTIVVDSAYIVKHPDLTRGTSVNDMEWVFAGDKITPIMT